jgi:hypothetical protein
MAFDQTRLNFVAALVVLLASAASAQTPQPRKPPNPAPPQLRAVSPSNTPETVPSEAGEGEIVAGFRSAKFGMNEPEVRQAIMRDFGVKADAIRAEDNSAEQTHVLIITVTDLLQGGGKAALSYVFGYKTKTLIQVGAIWSKATDDNMTPDRLFSNANILRAHFVQAGYRPETIATNAQVANGILMFRGSDAKDHTTMLLLQGTMETRDNQRVLTPNALLLFYVADAKSPDIFRLPPGQF